eukprot:scaffold422378_cov35-Attheya_sp.AAC.1
MRLKLGLMLGTKKGSSDIDGLDEGLIDGPLLVVEVDNVVRDGSVLVVRSSLGFCIGDSDTVAVGNIIDFKDGAIDLDGNPLGSVVGIRLALGPMLGTEEGSAEGLIDGPILFVGGSLEFSLGESDTVGRRLPLKDGPINADGILLIFVVGEILTLGPMLGLETGSNDLDGCNDGLLDGLVLSVGPSLGFC